MVLLLVVMAGPAACRTDLLFGGASAVIVGSTLVLCCVMLLLDPQEVQVGQDGMAGWVACTMISAECTNASPAQPSHGLRLRVHENVTNRVSSLRVLVGQRCRSGEAELNRLGLQLRSNGQCSAGPRYNDTAAGEGDGRIVGFLALTPPTTSDYLLCGLVAFLPLTCTVLGLCLVLASHPEVGGIVRAVEERMRSSGGLIPRCDVELGGIDAVKSHHRF